MESDSKAILLLCYPLENETQAKPLEPAEWTKYSENLNRQHITPAELVKMNTAAIIKRLGWKKADAERIAAHIQRETLINYDINAWTEKGINVVTVMDKDYPFALKRKLKNPPPVLFYSGDLTLANMPAIGFVGSRNITNDDIYFVLRTVTKTVSNGYTIVSGGASGSDETAAHAALNRGGKVVKYLAEPMTKHLALPGIVENVESGRILLFRAVRPDVDFTSAIALARNPFIYAHSCATVVVKSEFGSGGTWQGSTNAIKNKLCPVLCQRNNQNVGNTRLISLGAKPIDENWDGEIETEAGTIEDETVQEDAEQIRMEF